MLGLLGVACELTTDRASSSVLRETASPYQMWCFCEDPRKEGRRVTQENSSDNPQVWQRAMNLESSHDGNQSRGGQSQHCNEELQQLVSGAASASHEHPDTARHETRRKQRSKNLGSTVPLRLKSTSSQIYLLPQAVCANSTSRAQCEPM